MDIEQFRQFYQQNFYYIIAIQLAMGALLGAVPLILGIRNNRKNLGLIGFFVTVVLATVSPIVALIVAIVFTFVVRRGDAKPTGSDATAGDSSAAEAAADDSSGND